MDYQELEKVLIKTTDDICRNYDDKKYQLVYNKCREFLTSYSNLFDYSKEILSEESLNRLNLFFITFGRVLSNLEILEEAEKSFLYALSYKEDHYETYFALIGLYIKGKKFVSAEKMFYRAREVITDLDVLNAIETKFSKSFQSIAELKKTPKRILMGTLEIANQLYLLSKGLKSNGYETISVNYADVIYNNEYDIYIPFSKLKYMENVNKVLMQAYYQLFDNIDIFHFHFGATLFMDGSDLDVIMERKKPIIMHHWGSDVRQKSIAKKYSPDVEVKTEDREDIIVQNLIQLSSRIKYCIVPDFELYQYVEKYYSKIFVLPIAIDIDNYVSLVPSKGYSKKIVIGHAPTNRKVKGTDHIIKIVDKLKDKYPIELKLIEGVTHSEALKIYQQCDIIIDQVLIGQYGLFAIECMALGKPVIAFLNEFIMTKTPCECPIQNANMKELESVIEKLILDNELRYEVAIQGPVYVKNYHSINVVIPKLKAIYEEIWELEK